MGKQPADTNVNTDRYGVQFSQQALGSAAGNRAVMERAIEITKQAKRAVIIEKDVEAAWLEIDGREPVRKPKPVEYKPVEMPKPIKEPKSTRNPEPTKESLIAQLKKMGY
jgi:hypothetical protein